MTSRTVEIRRRPDVAAATQWVGGAVGGVSESVHQDRAETVRNGWNPNSRTVSVERAGSHDQPCTPAQVAAMRRLAVWLRDALGIPLDRTHHVGHDQFASVTRANCPGPFHPWDDLLGGTVFDVAKVRDQLWALAEQLHANGYPWLAHAITAAVALSKVEK